MRFNEIWDPSMYRSGDENDPRSPWYEDNSEQHDDELELRNIVIMDKDDNELTTKALVVVHVSAHRDGPSASELRSYRSAMRRARDDEDVDPPEGGKWEVDNVKLISVEFDGKKYSAEEAKAQFGDVETQDDVSDAIHQVMNG